MSKTISNVGLVLRGIAMGIAEVIPGVSGGTIAFITGIYEKLINTIKAIGPQALSALKSDGIKGLWRVLNGDFLVWLIGGMLIGIVGGVFGVTYLMEHYPEPLWAFFFGLILASALLIGKQIVGWDVKKVLALILGAIVAYLITTLSPAEGSLHPVYVFLSGMIAISALMLPGISGSFILLVMGMYTIIIPMVKETLRMESFAHLGTLVVFALGCLTGLAGFSRVLSWLFKTHRDITMALLTGFLIGALNKVWPWRNVSSVLDKESGVIKAILSKQDLVGLDVENIKILAETNVLPSGYEGNPMVIVSCVALVVGFLMVRFLEASSVDNA